MPLTCKYLLDVQVYMDLQVYASLRGRRLAPAPPLPVRLVPEVRAQTACRLVAGGALAALEHPPTSGPPALDHGLHRLHVGGGVVGEVRPAIPHLGRHVFGETQAAVRVEQSICSSAWT